LTSIKTAVIGFGISARVFHLPFLTTVPGYEVTTIMERSKNESAKVFPNTKIARDLNEILTDSTIELVVITTPNETHFEYSKESLEAGKHVVVEKPFTVTSAEANTLILTAKKCNRILTVYHNRRYVSDFYTVRQVLQEGVLGKVHEFFTHYDRYRPEAKPNAWREEAKPGSGILYDLGAHLLDQTCCFFGLPLYITADILQQRPHARVDDYFSIRLDYDHCKVHLHAGMMIREPGPRFIIHGEKGSFIKYGEDPQEVPLRAGKKPVGEDWGREPEIMYGHLYLQENNSVIKRQVVSGIGNFGNYYRDLFETIRNGAPLQVTPEQALNTIRLIELAFESSSRKCRVAVR